MTEPLSSSATDIDEAAALWLARLDSGTADRDAFDAWRAEDPRHAAAFARIAATDDLLQGLAGQVEEEDPDLEPRTVLTRRGLLQVALVAIAGAGLGLWMMSRNRAHAQTPVGGRQSLTLGQGAELDLNTNTCVSWTKTGSVWKVRLARGEVRASVSPRHAPLVLTGGGQTVRVSDGDIDAHLENGRLKVIVLRGVAHIGSGAQAVTSQVGEEAMVTPAGVQTRALGEGDIDFRTGWRRGELVLNGQSLADVVFEFNRYLTSPIVIDDPSLANIRLGGRFTNQDPGDFLSALAASFSVRSHVSADGVIHLTR
ncbi:MAG TPA: DUF4880 domain-containing protein [Asticcacaulis sp.]|nr:DUF4880 domain-containing protein [Asticcacaulis sp.]